MDLDNNNATAAHRPPRPSHQGSAGPSPASLPPERGGLAAARPREPSEPLLILNIVAQMAFGLLAMTICLPSMQEWDTLFGVDAASVQLTFSGYVVSYGALQLLYGPLSDRHGRRRVLLVGLALGGAASLAAAFAGTLSALVAARVMQGAGCAACMVVGRALVQDHFDGPQRTRVMAYIGMAMGVCPPLGTVIGGQLHALLGWQANFVLLAGLALALMVAAWRGLPAGRAPATTATALEVHWLRAMGRAYARLVREPSFLLYATIPATIAAAFYAFLGGAPFVLRSYGVGPASVGWYMMIPPTFYIAGNYLASRLTHRCGEQRMMAIGEVFSLAGIGLVLALSGLATPLAFVLPLVLLCIGHGLLMPPALAATIGIVPALAGSAAALAGVLQQLTGALGGYAVGWVSHEGPFQVALVMLFFMLCVGAAQLLLWRRAPR
jgi:DHA1 family bicyclomycin/chloramphenicol resistance-like MFS transporter